MENIKYVYKNAQDCTCYIFEEEPEIFKIKEENDDSGIEIYTCEKLINGEYKIGHWAENLSMIIIKNGIKIILNSEELKLLVKGLPKTAGGRY